MSLHLAQPGERPSCSPRVRLKPLTRLDVEQARKFLMELPGRTDGADLPRAMYLLGLLGGHAQNLLDALDAITTFGDET